MRKKIVGKEQTEAASRLEGLDIAEIATVMVTSESDEYPVENMVDGWRGPGASRWVAAEPGEQTLILEFDAPQTLQRINLEIEEQEVTRTQELQLAISHDGGKTYQELVRQEFNFSPPGTTFEGEEWSVKAEQITHLRLTIKPDKGGKLCRATVTSLLVLQ